jgi:hypothetical protein
VDILESKQVKMVAIRLKVLQLFSGICSFFKDKGKEKTLFELGEG